MALVLKAVDDSLEVGLTLFENPFLVDRLKFPELFATHLYRVVFVKFLAHSNLSFDPFRDLFDGFLMQTLIHCPDYSIKCVMKLDFFHASVERNLKFADVDEQIFL